MIVEAVAAAFACSAMSLAVIVVSALRFTRWLVEMSPSGEGEQSQLDEVQRLKRSTLLTVREEHCKQLAWKIAHDFGDTNKHELEIARIDLALIRLS
jgi:hypothetical protein